MRIMYFLAHPNGIGGAAKVMIKHAHIMQKMGNEILAVIQEGDEGYYSTDFEKVCNELEVKFCSLQYSVAICIEEIDCFSSLRDLPRVEELVQSYSPTIIYSLQLNLAVEMTARKFNIPNVMCIYQALSDMFTIKWPDVFAKYHITDSEYYSRIWSEGLGVMSRCIRVPYEPKQIERDKKRDDAIEIVNVAVIQEHKRQYEILEFISKCRDKELPVHATFVGDDDTEYGAKCRKYVRDNGLSRYVNFTGFVNDVEKYIVNADVMIHASIAESYPGAIVEAMAYGLPVIAAPSGGISELIVNGVNGFLTEGFDSDDIYKAFQQYLKCKDEGNIRQVIENEKGVFFRYHTYENVGKELISFQKDILEADNQIRNSNALEEICDIVRDSMGKDLQKYASKHTYERAFYLYHVREICQKNNYKTAAIWGTGNLGGVGLEWANILEMEIKFYIDSDKKGYYEGYEIVRPAKEIVDKVDVVIVSVGRLEVIREIKSILEMWGLVRNKTFFLVQNSSLL